MSSFRWASRHPHSLASSFLFSLGVVTTSFGSVYILNSRRDLTVSPTQQTKRPIRSGSSIGLFDNYPPTPPPSRSVPLSIYGVIAANGAVFAGWQYPPLYSFLSKNFVHHPNNPNYTMLTSAFSHQTFLHLGFNMMVLHDFGRIFYNSIDRQLPLATAFYLSSASISSLGSHAINTITRSPPRGSVGASGALYGILGSITVTNPNLPVGIMFLPFHVPLSTMLPALMAMDVVGLASKWTFLDHGAHLGGAVGGLLFAWLYQNYGEKLGWKGKSSERPPRKEVTDLDLGAYNTNGSGIMDNRTVPVCATATASALLGLKVRMCPPVQDEKMHEAKESRSLLIPEHANPLGIAFGGAILAWVDVCAGIGVKRQATPVSASVDAVHFLSSLRVGDRCILKAKVNRSWNSSMESALRLRGRGPHPQRAAFLLPAPLFASRQKVLINDVRNAWRRKKAMEGGSGLDNVRQITCSSSAVGTPIGSESRAVEEKLVAEMSEDGRFGDYSEERCRPTLKSCTSCPANDGVSLFSLSMLVADALVRWETLKLLLMGNEPGNAAGDADFCAEYSAAHFFRFAANRCAIIPPAGAPVANFSIYCEAIPPVDRFV
ncbi:hypothetical protein BJ742DRAFT_772149 [Cladochytrium replicatum]|nr:hypothetical protein BJ742DRAFT_772149 [Cladochytrium replicatum]